MALILLIDDEADVRSAVGHVLERAGYAVSVASDGQEGIRIAAESPVDLVVTDIMMPGMDGIELILELREQHPEIPIIAISGGGEVVPSELLLSDAHELGAVTSLAKPFEMEELLSAVERALS